MDSAPATNNLLVVWAAAAVVAAFGTWVLYDALPGINWVLWTAAATGVVALAGARGVSGPSRSVPGATAVAIAGAAALTASPLLHFLICASVAVLLAMQMLLAGGASPGRITARFAATAPVVGLKLAAVHAVHCGIEATDRVRSPRVRGWVRGLAITLPVVIAFGLLLAEADPILASWRDAMAALLSWDLLRRAVFFTGLLGLVLGAYGYVARAPVGSLEPRGEGPQRWLGATEQAILLGGVAALLWLFLGLQLGYFFGTLPREPGSGVTFAEYARRGFAELTVVASASIVLVVLSERYGQRGGLERLLRILTFGLVAAVLLVLASAWHRVRLYQAAYGFTTARLYAQAYMAVVAAALLFVWLEVARGFDGDRLFRRTALVATLLFIALIYWNHEAWIARQNIDRFATTGQLDVRYLTQGLSLDAVPAIAERLPSLPEPVRSELDRALRARYASGPTPAGDRWYEWNRRRAAARAVLGAQRATGRI
jgi:two-component system sensor histidine kinase BaeS